MMPGRISPILFGKLIFFDQYFTFLKIPGDEFIQDSVDAQKPFFLFFTPDFSHPPVYPLQLLLDNSAVEKSVMR
jgi:hypothetical protein